MKRSHLLPCVILAALPVASSTSPAQAGTGGFQAGDVYVYSAALDAQSAGGGIVHVDPAAGTATFFHDLPTTPSVRGVMCYDPWRDRLLFYGGFVNNSAELYASDAAGNVTSLGYPAGAGPSIALMAPRGDGKVYCVAFGNLTIQYLDVDDVIRNLKDATGTANYTGVWAGSLWAMHYDQATNQLFAAGSSYIADCPGEVPDETVIYAMQLSADGTRVLSESCTTYEVAPNFQNEIVEGLSQGPNGDVYLAVSTDGTDPEARMARIDPVTLTATPFATNDYFGAGILRGAVYSHVLGKGLVLDAFNDVLRAYGPGESGTGTPVVSSGVSYPGISSEVATVVEVSPSASLWGLSASTSSVSLSAGGSQTLDIDFGAAHGGEIHLVLGSATGWTPGIAGSPHVPLNVDGYLLYTLFTPNTVPLANSLGFLDGAGQATCTFSLPAGTDPSLAGAVLHHAALALDGSFAATRASNPVPVALVP